jgi:uroporphyrinogen-III synthase
LTCTCSWTWTVLPDEQISSEKQDWTDKKVSSPLTNQGFAGRRVVAFESRRAEAMEQLIRTHGGVPLVAPSMREVPIEENTDAFDFARELLEGRIDIVIFLTGVGVRFLSSVIETRYPREQWIGALSQTSVIARGPKPVAALRELGVPIRLSVPEPNTWRELLASLDEQRAAIPLQDRAIAIQEYGAPNQELIHELEARGAKVRPVHVYQWALPTDTTPLRTAIQAIAHNELDIALFTTSTQVVHLVRLAAEMGLDAEMRRALSQMMIASIGPTTSETLRQYGLHVDLEPTHPRMGILVKEAAERCKQLS